MENESKTVADRRDKSAARQPETLETNLCESQKNDDVIGNTEVGKKEVVATASSTTFLPDVRSDQPTSTIEVQRDEEVRPTKSSSDTQEVPDSVAEREPEELDVDYGTSSIDDTCQEEPTTFEDQEEILNSDAITTGNESEPPDIGRKRPTRVTRRPTSFQDTNFETQFQPTERKRKCRKIKRKDQAGNSSTDNNNNNNNRFV